MSHPQTLSHFTSFSPLTNYANIPYHCTPFIKAISQWPGRFNLIDYYEKYQKHKTISETDCGSTNSVRTADSYAEYLAAAVARGDGRSPVSLANLVTCSMVGWMSVPSQTVAPHTPLRNANIRVSQGPAERFHGCPTTIWKCISPKH